MGCLQSFACFLPNCGDSKPICLCLIQEKVMAVSQEQMEKSRHFGRRHKLRKESRDGQEDRWEIEAAPVRFVPFSVKLAALEWSNSLLLKTQAICWCNFSPRYCNFNVLYPLLFSFPSEPIWQWIQQLQQQQLQQARQRTTKEEIHRAQNPNSPFHQYLDGQEEDHWKVSFH